MGSGITQKTGKSKRGHWTAKQRQYVDRCVEFGCLLTWIKHGISGTPAEWNHARSGGAGMKPPHQEGYALSPEYHRLGDESLSALGIKGWQEHHEVRECELVAISKEKFGWKE